MMRNASCFIILFHVINELQFFIEASKSNPLTCVVEPPCSEHQISCFAYECIQNNELNDTEK